MRVRAPRSVQELALPAVAGLAAMTPLLTAIGRNLEYEYALLASYALLLFLPLLALLYPLTSLCHPAKVPSRFWRENVGAATLVLAVGSGWFALTACPCSGKGYLFWLVLLDAPALALALGAHYGVSWLRRLGFGRGRVALVWLGAYAFDLALLAARLWFNPQKRTVDLLAGFLHGPIYDTSILVDAGIGLAAFSHFLLGLALLAFFAGGKHRVKWACAFAAAYLAVMTAALNYPSMQAGKATLDRLLPEVMNGDSFTLHYQDAPRDESESEGTAKLAVLRLFRDTSFHVHELKALLGQTAEHVDVYVYPNSATKKLWFGGGATDVTDVVMPSVHIAIGPWPHPTLRHELVHALASSFGFHGLGFHPNMAFTEGLAVALAPSERDLTLDDGAASLLKSGRLNNIRELFSPMFWRFSGSRAYTAAGSLINFLIRTYGMASVRQLYAGASWDEAVHTSGDRVLALWRASVLQHYDEKRERLVSEQLYRNPGLLQELCPHTAADYATSPTLPETFWAWNLRVPSGWDPERSYWPWRLAVDPANRSAQLDLWQDDIARAARLFAMASGPGQILLKRELNDWVKRLAAQRSWPPRSLEDVDMALLQSDVERLMGDKSASMKPLQELASYGRDHSLGDSTARQVAARLKIEALLDDKPAAAWRSYLAGWTSKLPKPVRNDEPWLLTYLRLRRGAPEELETLDNLLERAPQKSLPATFGEEWYRLIAQDLMLEEHYPNAARAYRLAAAYAAPASQRILQEEARRADYYAKLGPLNAAVAH